MQSYFKTIDIRGLRGFGDKQRLGLSIPNGDDGSGLTILVGPNNGGKSTVLEAIHIVSRQAQIQLGRSDRNRVAHYEIQIQASWVDGFTATLASESANPAQITPMTKGARETERSAYFVSAQRELGNQLSKGPDERSEFVQSQDSANNRQSSPIGARLKKACKERAIFDQLFSQVLGDTASVDFSMEGNEVYVHAEPNEHRPIGLGRGIRAVVSIIDSLYDAPDGSLILIDEPELALHPQLQRQLLCMLAKEATKHQIVYSTHSPYMVDWRFLLAGATLARVFRSRTGTCRISQLSPKTAESLRSQLNNLNNPHVLGTDAKEVFFLPDRVILVEGQEDVVCFEKMLKELKVRIRSSFFGWGVGGAANMRLLCQVLRDLGYERVVGILDGNMEKLAAKLRKEFAEYSFKTLPTDDVRDKLNPDKSTRIKGLCDTSGQIHDEYKQEMIQFFSLIDS